MSHHLIEVNGLTHTYPDGTPALRGVSFRITHGEAVAIIGANGAGKSTLLHHLNGYLLPTQGEVRVGGCPVTKTTLPTVRRTVGMVFQDPDDQLFMPTVFDDVAFGPLHLGFSAGEAERKVTEALSTVGALHLKDRPPYRLSGGEKRAVAIATVLSMTPDILVMDEPTASLDPRSRRRVINLLKSFTHTKIIATHDLDMAMDVCARVLVLHEGAVVADRPAKDGLRDAPTLEACGLEVPLRLQSCPVCSPASAQGQDDAQIRR